MRSKDKFVNLYVLYTMAPNGTYSREQKKAIGSFYTPPIVADFLAQLVSSLIPSGGIVSCLDPAVGDGVLLHSILLFLTKDRIHSLSGVDIDKKAISAVINSFSRCELKTYFKETDALKPLGAKTCSAGWKRVRSKVDTAGFDVIVCNPPWGADLSQYHNLGESFSNAVGQFDIYDLFIELIVNQLKDGGVYGLIVPDSIFSKEHLRSRQLLLDETCISHIVKLGESFFPDVNSSVSIIIGRKQINQDSCVRCTHVSPNQRKAILSNETCLIDIENNNHIDVPQDYMISRGWEMVTDTTKEDIDLLARLDLLPKIKSVSSSRRGVELSKRGLIWCCPKCHKWSPMPPSNRNAHCSFCDSDYITGQLSLEHIVVSSDEKLPNSVPITIGEDIHRYSLKESRRIVLGYSGINYKEADCFKGKKIVVRKTGVGISAAIDYYGHYTNQVVYILKTNDEKSTPTELLMAVINSRIITYYLMKSKSVNQWQTHPYLTQDDLGGLPFPNLESYNKSDLVEIIKEIKRLVRILQNNENTISFNKVDAKLERLLAELLQINENDYRLIYRALQSAQQMIPFRCLLDIDVNAIWR